MTLMLLLVRRWFPLETTITEDMSSIWGDWGVCSEVDKLKAVLMRRPGKEVENFDWKAARFRAPIDPEKFRAQHDALADVYRAHVYRYTMSMSSAVTAPTHSSAAI